MNTISDKVVKYKKSILTVFIILLLLSAVFSRLVSVNYDLTKYLPEDSPSTTALNVMTSEFTTNPPNARILLENVTIPEALSFKDTISSIDGVVEVTWLDDSTNVYTPLELMPKEILNSFYKDSNALFNVVIDSDKSIKAVGKLQALLEERGEITGEIVDNVTAQTSSGKETSKMLIFLLPTILIILLLTTSSWFEPVLFMIVIAVAIAINNGTNAFLGEISFITKSTSAILLLAVSMDYSIFLLHRFSEYREEGLDVQSAIVNAMKKSFSSILASGLTTAIGFGALIFMRFKIGPDLGIVLAKGIFIGMASIMLLLPILTIYTYKLIDKTKHRSFVPSFKGLSKVSTKIGKVAILIVLLIMYPAYLSQDKNDFIYGSSAMTSSSDTLSKTDELFGQANNMVLLVPKGNLPKEKALYQTLISKDYINSVISYGNKIGTTIPTEFVPEDKLSMLQSEKYSRFILTLSTSQESESSFKAVEEIREIGKDFYGEEALLSGGTSNVYDMKSTIISDNKVVTLIGILGIGLVLLFTFKSLTLPIILLITIETSIWINLSFTYFSSEKLAYLGFMIISAIQLGATVDYAILFANRYLENRKVKTKYKACRETICDTSISILTSGSILMIAGIIMGFVSTNGVISQLGVLIGRGTFISMLMVLFFLPTTLVLLDKIIQKTTLKCEFYNESKDNTLTN